MAKINLNQMVDAEEYSDTSYIRGFRKGVQTSVQGEDIRLSNDNQACSKRQTSNYRISLRRHEREMYKSKQAKRIANRERAVQEEELNAEAGMSK